MVEKIIKRVERWTMIGRASGVGKNSCGRKKWGGASVFIYVE
jgi:hypothetical protein